LKEVRFPSLPFHFASHKLKAKYIFRKEGLNDKRFTIRWNFPHFDNRVVVAVVVFVVVVVVIVVVAVLATWSFQ
jgi:hypothetical protein